MFDIRIPQKFYTLKKIGQIAFQNKENKMLRKYDVIQCPDIERFETNKKYNYHMSRVFHSKCAIDTSQPELSPRHRMIAQKAEARRREYMKRTRASISPKFSVKGFPYSTRPTSLLATSSSNNQQTIKSQKASNALASSAKNKLSTSSKVSVSNTPLFRSPAPYVEPTDFDFLDNFVPFQPTQTRHEKAMESSKVYFQSISQLTETNYDSNVNEDDDINNSSDDLDDDLSSISSESEDI